VDFIKWLFDPSGFPPRWQCGSGWAKTPWLGWLHIVSDIGVWSAYLAIPLVLAYFLLRRKDLPFRKIFLLFGAFILACGTTHLMEAIIFWYPAYRLAAVIKFSTALVSWATVFALFRIVPGVLTMRSPEELEREIVAREKAEISLEQANVELERQVETLRNESRFRVMAEGIPHCVWVSDSAGSNEYHNRAWYEFTGTSPDRGHGLEWLDFYHPADRAHLLEEWKKALATDGSHPYDAEARLRRSDGEYRWFRVKGTPIKNDGGGVAQWVGTCSDIHEQRVLLDTLHDADRRKDEFLATLAHELRNPLAPVRNAVQVLHMKGPDVPELQWARDVIDRQTRAMIRLIDDLMDVSRINQGKIELKRERVELAAVFQGAVETSQPLIEQCGHVLTVTLPPNPVVLDADLTRLSQVFLNLLNNAAKYTERGGRIDFRAEQQGSDVVVSVRDTGIGIPPDKLPTIFEMFSQVEGALSRSQGGLGIGLCLVKRLVEMHGGSVEARSEGRGKGSEFIVRLPIVVERAYTHTAIEDDKAMLSPGLRVLVVDDNRDSASGLMMLIKMKGGGVRMAYDGEEAVQAAGEFRPHIVLCDIGLPKMNGYDACRLMKQRAWDKGMVLIAVTGWGQEDDKRKAEEAGFAYHIVKPADPRALMKLLSGLDVVKALGAKSP
jgi:two-component system CheB/CheR fusion protein